MLTIFKQPNLYFYQAINQRVAFLDGHFFTSIWSKKQQFLQIILLIFIILLLVTDVILHRKSANLLQHIFQYE